MPVWNDKMAEHHIASGQVSVCSALTWSLLRCNGYQFCSYHMWVLQHHFVHAFDMGTIIVLVYLGFEVKRSQFSSNNAHHTSCIPKGSHAGKWPDLMTSKPDSVSTVGYHWTDHTGRLLEPQVHWDVTGTTLADASIQWCSNGDPVLICIIGTHLEDHWKATGRPLEAHWNHTGYQQFFLQWHSSEHWGLSSRYTRLPLEDHWLRVRVSFAEWWPFCFGFNMLKFCTFSALFPIWWNDLDLDLRTA